MTTSKIYISNAIQNNLQPICMHSLMISSKATNVKFTQWINDLYSYKLCIVTEKISTQIIKYICRKNYLSYPGGETLMVITLINLHNISNTTMLWDENNWLNLRHLHWSNNNRASIFFFHYWKSYISYKTCHLSRKGDT